MGVEANIHAALIGRVEVMEAALSIPVAYPGRTVDTSGDYLRVTHNRPSPVRSRILGSEPLDRVGILHLDLFTVAQGDSYQVTSDVLADQIIGYFARDLRLTKNGVEVKIYSAYALTADRPPDSGAWMTPIRVEYVCTA